MRWTLLPVGVIYGLVAALVFRRCTDSEAIRRAMNRVIAHLLELRLFFDSPRVVLRAHRDLVLENLRILRLVLVPGVILAAIFTVLYPRMDALYGHGPLEAGTPAVVTVRLDAGESPELQLEPPPGIHVESPPVYAVHEHEVSWLVRPLGTTSGEMKVRYQGMVLPKHVAVPWPRTSILGVSWLLWFSVISSAAALGYRP